MKKQCKVCNKVVNFGSNVNATTCKDCLTEGYKYCSQCATVKPLSTFKVVGKAASGATRYSGECQDCAKLRAATYYTAHAERIKKQTNAYRKQHLSNYVQYSNKYAERNPIKRTKQRSEALKKYRRTPHGRMTVKHNNAVYARNAQIGDLTATQWQSILTLFEFKCAYCGSTDKLSMEHLLPVSRGGTLTKRNIIVACQHCNSSRGNKDLNEWLQGIDEARKTKIIWYINEGHKSIE